MRSLKLATLTSPYVPDKIMFNEMKQIYDQLQLKLGNKSRDVVHATPLHKELVREVVIILASATALQMADPVQAIQLYREMNQKIRKMVERIEPDFEVYHLMYLRPTLAWTIHALWAYIVNNPDFVESFINFYSMLDDETYALLTWMMALFQGLYPEPSG